MDTYKNYLIDLVSLLKEAAAEARAAAESKQPFEAGRALAYAEVIALMQSQADAFMIAREKLNLDGFDAMCDFGRAEGLKPS